MRPSRSIGRSLSSWRTVTHEVPKEPGLRARRMIKVCLSPVESRKGSQSRPVDLPVEYLYIAIMEVKDFER